MSMKLHIKASLYFTVTPHTGWYLIKGLMSNRNNSYSSYNKKIKKSCFSHLPPADAGLQGHGGWGGISEQSRRLDRISVNEEPRESLPCRRVTTSQGIMEGKFCGERSSKEPEEERGLARLWTASMRRLGRRQKLQEYEGETLTTNTTKEWDRYLEQHDRALMGKLSHRMKSTTLYLLILQKNHQDRWQKLKVRT